MDKKKIVSTFEPDDIKAQIEKDCRLAIRWDVNLAYQSMSRIMKLERKYQSEMFQYVLETWGDIDQEKLLPVPEVVTKEEERKYERLYGDMADALLKGYLLMGLDDNWTKEEFYERLWEGIWGNIIWDDDKKRAFILYYIAIDVRIPYYPISRGININKREFNFIAKELVEKGFLKKFNFIEAVDWNNKIEQTSQVLKLLDEPTNEKEKSVLLALILHEYERSVKEYYSKDESNEII